MSKKRSWESYKEEMLENNPKKYKILNYIGIFKGKHTKVLLSCDIHGEWNTTSINNFLKGRSCPKCGKQYKATLNEYIERINEINPNFKIIGTVDKFIGERTKLVLYCYEHGIWKSSNIKSILHQKSSCPKCAKFGYKKDKAGNFYIHKIIIENNVYYKVGITNYYDTRYKQQCKNKIKPGKVVNYSISNGDIPFILESYIKSTYNFETIDRDLYSDGFTEIVNYDTALKIIQYVETYLQQNQIEYNITKYSNIVETI